jgi:hypothetical protein
MVHGTYEHHIQYPRHTAKLHGHIQYTATQAMLQQAESTLPHAPPAGDSSIKGPLLLLRVPSGAMMHAHNRMHIVAVRPHIRLQWNACSILVNSHTTHPAASLSSTSPMGKGGHPTPPRYEVVSTRLKATSQYDALD